MMNAIVAPAIRKIIQQRGIKQCVIAKNAGYTKQQFYAMLTGRRLIRDTDIIRIADALEVDVNTLFQREVD